MIFAGTPDAPCPRACRVIDFDFRQNREIAEIGEIPAEGGRPVYCYRAGPFDVRALLELYLEKSFALLSRWRSAPKGNFPIFITNEYSMDEWIVRCLEGLVSFVRHVELSLFCRNESKLKHRFVFIMK